MLRSRSSFDDLAAAIASANSLEPAKPEKDKVKVLAFNGAPLVPFGGGAEPPRAPLPPSSRKAIEVAPLDEVASADGVKRPPKLPDLSAVVSPILRCEKIVEWIIEATGASDVFL